MAEFLKGSFSSAWLLLQFYGVMVGGGAIGVLALAVVYFTAVGIWSGLERLSILSLLANAWTTTIAFLREARLTLSNLAELIRQHAIEIAPKALLGFGPWLITYFLLRDVMENPAVYGGGSVIISLPLCLVSWVLILWGDKQRPKLSELPKVVVIAVLWAAPALAIFPLCMASP